MTAPERLDDAEREELSRLFGYVPEPEPLEQMLAAVERIVAQRVARAVAEARAEALREAAEAWQVNGWANVLLPKPQPPAIPVIAYSNRVLDWLRGRADREGQQ